MTVHTLLGMLLLGNGGAAGLAAEPFESPELALTVLVDDAAGVPEHQLRDAEKVVRYVYERLGVRVDWFQCSAAPESGGLPPCGRMNGNRLLVRILPESRSSKLAAKPSEAGIALLGASRPGTRAYIFHDRLKRISRRNPTQGGLLLGRVIAHELGHLLLGTHGHGGKGIMQPVMGNYRERTSLAGAFFTGSEAQRVRQALLRVKSPPNLLADRR